MHLLGIVVGFFIAWWVRRWYWAPVAGAPISFVSNGAIDWIVQGDMFLHQQEMIFEALEFSGWVLVFYFLGPTKV